MKGNNNSPDRMVLSGATPSIKSRDNVRNIMFDALRDKASLKADV